MIRILFVDDEPIAKIAFRKLLDWETSDYRLVETASNGLEALKFLEIQTVDIVITDLKMPIMGGIELIKALKNTAYQGLILVMSNYSDFELVREALIEGATDYMLKVNMTKDTLLQQLSKMTVRLRENQAQLAQQEHTAFVTSQQAKQFSLTQLRAYLLDTTDHLPEALPFGFPVYPFTLSFHSDTVQKEKLKTILSYAEDMIRDLFKEIQDLIILKMHANELFCILPTSAFTQENISLEHSLNQLMRRIHMYFSLPCTLFFITAQEGLAQLKTSYSQLTQSYPVHFYKQEILFDCNQLPSFKMIPDEDAVHFITLMSKASNETNLEVLYAEIDSFLEKCQKEFFHPTQVKGFFIKALEYLSFSNFDSERSLTLNHYTETLTACTSLTSLKNILKEAFKALMTSTPAPISSEKKEIQEVLYYIHTHYKMKLSLEHLALSVNLNSSYLCRLFKQEVGISIFNYINKIRMEKAAQLIKANKGIYIKEIAMSVGIDDPFYFTRKFKEYYGKNPTDYKA